MWSVNGSRLIKIPQACTPVWRTEPSSVSANLIVLAISGLSEDFSFFRSGFSLNAFLKVIFGASGTSFAKRSASGSGSFSTLATSRMASFVAIVPNVQMCATLSWPYLSVTYLSTFSRPSSSKSISTSGNEIRSGFRNRSKSRSYLIGSMLVIPVQ